MTRDQKDITLHGMAGAEWKLQNLFLILLYIFILFVITKNKPQHIGAEHNLMREGWTRSLPASQSLQYQQCLVAKRYPTNWSA